MIKINSSVTNCYLIPVDDKYLLVDTGYNRDNKLFFKKLNKYNISLLDISYIFITHSHDDHVGLVNYIITNNPSCKVILHFKAIEKLTLGYNNMTNSSYINKRVSFLTKIFSKLFKGGFIPYYIKEDDIIIKKDMRFKELGININGKIIYTPGHTDDSISIVLDDGTCLSGDATANMFNFLGTKHCIIVLEDLKQYYYSWGKIINEKSIFIYPGHGKSFSIEKLKNDLYKQNIKNLQKIKSSLK